MAPQQNSTLINENLDVFPSLLNIPEEINRYSPILPLKNKNKLDNNNNNYCKENREEVHFASKCNELTREPHHYHKYKHNRVTNNRSGHNHRSRSISLHGANSTIEQGHKEITIWLSDGPRYVSGVTNKTTCNDIIKALIDDEISNGNYLYCQRLKEKDGTASRDYSDYVITECWRGIERSYDGQMAILPVWKAWSRVHNEKQLSADSKFAIIRALKDGKTMNDVAHQFNINGLSTNNVEREADSGRSHKSTARQDHQMVQIRWSLKHRKDIQDPTKALKTNTTISSIRNYICKMLSFGKTKKKQEKTKSKIPNINSVKCKLQGDEKNKCALISNHCTAHIQPQCQLPLQSNLQNLMYRGKQTNVENNLEESSNKCTTKSNRKKLYKLSESRTTLRKRRSSSRRKEKKCALQKRNDNIVGDANNFLRKRKDSSIRSSVRNKLAQKNAEINDLFDREYALTKELSNKFKIYKLRNELYTASDKNLELSVGQIQQNIEACAKDIIRTEHELLEIKNEIKHDISIINNLKRLTLESDLNQCGVPTDDEAKDLKHQLPKGSTLQSSNITTKLQCKQMEFVDNIYEFCDNNASMLV